MADPVWGLLAKAQDDPQTISEAISAAIAAHESDPEAHLGSGESLETHRTNETIDHPAGSVLSDKSTKTEFVFNESFATTDHLGAVGEVNLDSYPQLTIYVEHGAVEYSSIFLPVEVVADWISYDHDWMIQMALRVQDLRTNLKYWWGEDFNNKITAFGIGFIVESGQLKATEKSDSTRQSVNISGVDVEDGHIYRVQFSVADGKLYYYIDGVQVASLTPHSLSYGSDGGPSVGIDIPSGSGDSIILLSSMTYARAVD
jgi:hypothetical protein